MSILDLVPTRDLAYPSDIVEERAKWLEEYQKLPAKPTVAARLALLIRFLRLTAKQVTFENVFRTRAFAVHELTRVNKERRLIDGS